LPIIFKAPPSMCGGVLISMTQVYRWCVSTVVVLEFVVDGLNVGDANTALVPHPRRRFAQYLIKTLEHWHGELRPGIKIRRHEVGTTWIMNNKHSNKTMNMKVTL